MTDAEEIEKLETALTAQTKKVDMLIGQVTALLNTMNAFLQSADIEVVDDDEQQILMPPVSDEHLMMYN